MELAKFAIDLSELARRVLAHLPTIGGRGGAQRKQLPDLTERETHRLRMPIPFDQAKKQKAT